MGCVSFHKKRRPLVWSKGEWEFLFSSQFLVSYFSAFQKHSRFQNIFCPCHSLFLQWNQQRSIRQEGNSTYGRGRPYMLVARAKKQPIQWAVGEGDQGELIWLYFGSYQQEQFGSADFLSGSTIYLDFLCLKFKLVHLSVLLLHKILGDLIITASCWAYFVQLFWESDWFVHVSMAES